MANAVLVDSNYYITRLRAGSDPFTELAAAGERWEPVTCGIVMLEVLRGAGPDAVYQNHRETFEIMTCVPTTSRVWTSATDLLRTLGRRGFTIPPQDALIAACALSIDAPVLTFDRHFSLVPGLTTLDSLP